MLFNSYTFIVFFVIVLIASKAIGNWNVRKGFLLLCSYLFYAAWNPPFVALLWISTIVDWFVARAIFRSKKSTSRKILLFISLFTNLGMLGFFKYGNFFLENFTQALELLGIHFHSKDLGIILPVGISFYTFQTLSYTLDVFFKKMPPSRSFLDYALYVTFFPQLVAGPIVRAQHFLPQCESPVSGSFNQISWGCCMFTVGLFAKVVIADELMAPIVEQSYAIDVTPGFLTAWAGTVAFAMQIFYDFFGYSTCAIGVALCLGFELPDNFRFPYAARGFSDFWKRWHISLSSWLRDYLYVPLGGNRKGRIRTDLNLLTTMLLGGLWHGASWMFIIWGGLHGIYLIFEKLIQKSPLSRMSIWKTLAGKIALCLLTFALTCITWVFFRATNLESAITIVSQMFDISEAISLATALFGGLPSIDSVEPVALGKLNYFIVGATVTSTLALHNHLRSSSLEDFFSSLPLAIRVISVSLMLYLTTISMTGENSAFIYFQF